MTEDNEDILIQGCWIGLQSQVDDWQYSNANFDDVVWTDGTNSDWNAFQEWGIDISAYNYGGIVGGCGYISVLPATSTWTGGRGAWLMADCEEYRHPFICELNECQDGDATTTYGACFDFYGCGSKQELQCECVDASEKETEDGASAGMSKA